MCSIHARSRRWLVRRVRYAIEVHTAGNAEFASVCPLKQHPKPRVFHPGHCFCGGLPIDPLDRASDENAAAGVRVEEVAVVLNVEAPNKVQKLLL
eukprot:CAMPEP_0174854368 /NCGR_PEP_ID=MMETSP1114-20130205/30952_1 /TAXON_ID=312471 /ORGANISM="Neobodo designis, Strain CCAP 1951/1" /LENGTH=94 /DNA_ID=CAMNT_0016089059 /DNA_START=1 /DNA_END=282 /DNA_ORIENTATION=-